MLCERSGVLGGELCLRLGVLGEGLRERARGLCIRSRVLYLKKFNYFIAANGKNEAYYFTC